MWKRVFSLGPVLGALVGSMLGGAGCGQSIPPLIVGLDNRSVQVGGLLEQTVRGTVPGSLSLQEPYPMGVKLVPLSGETATGLLRWIPLASDVGDHTLTVTLDARGDQVSESLLVTVLPSELGRPQFLGTPYNLLLDLSVARSVTANIVVKDDDDTSDTLEVVAGSELANAELAVEPDGKRGTLTFTPSAAQLQDRCSFSTQLRARDPKGMEVRAGVFIEARNGCGAEPGVLINEILFDPPTGKDVNGDGKSDQLLEEEFVELVNITDRTIELGGATLSDSVQVRYTFPTPTTLAPKQSVVVFGGGAPKGFPADIKVLAVPAGGFGGQGLSLNNAGDTVLLRSSDGAVIDSVTYPAACVACADGINQSVTRQTELNRNTRFIAHNKATGAVGLYSPGRRVNGQPF